MSQRWKTVLYVVSSFAFLEPVGSAQCPVPDRLDGGPCCTTVAPDVPRTATFTQDAFDICWRDCDVDSFRTCTATWERPVNLPKNPNGMLPWGIPSAGLCAPRLSRLSLRDASGALKWRGLMRLTYARTWLETDGTGDQMQVWRFLVNGDLRLQPNAGLTPCPVPPCASAHKGKVRYTGYIDYAKDCDTGTFEYAWMLNHGCDALDHAPNFPRAGFFHFNRAYTFVGPSASFAIGPIQSVAAGGGADEDVRRIKLPAPGTLGPMECEYEELVDHALEVLQELCICGFPTAPLQYMIGDLGLASSCGTTIFTPGGPYLPGYVSMGIGAWTDASTYPGLETLRWTTGGYDYFDPCTGNTREEVFFGVTTLGGYAPSRVLSVGSGFPMPSTFVDQANSLRANNHKTTMNVPFISDHVLNLNYD